jgi:hypothetical protein
MGRYHRRRGLSLGEHKVGWAQGSSIPHLTHFTHSLTLLNVAISRVSTIVF